MISVCVLQGNSITGTSRCHSKSVLLCAVNAAFGINISLKIEI